ncbi:MAG: flagellar hook-length control protein FliK [Anaerolineae bacterium]
MNINPVTPNPVIIPDGSSSNPAATEMSTGGFNQMLQALSTTGPVNVAAALPNAAKSSAWPLAWLEILGQSPNTSGPALDLLEEAPSLANLAGESAVSLTEIMTALQPIVTESQANPSLPVADEPLQPIPAHQRLELDEANLALLTLMSGFNPLQPITATPPLPALPTTTEAAATPMVQSVPAWIPEMNGEPSSQAQATQAQPATPGQVTTEPASVAAPPAPLETATPAHVNSTFAQELDRQMTVAPVSSGANQAVEPAATISPEPTLKPKVEAIEAAPSQVLVAETFNSQSTNNLQPSTFNVQTTNVQLPDIPALHQIVERLSVMTQHGQTEVRLHLHPESLGQLSIQLHFVDGDIAVRMVAETAQAQKLIQEYLPQLKAAFSAQGLQLNDMAVAVGGGASSFDLAGQRPNNHWSQQPAHSPAYPTLSDKPEPAATRPVRWAWSNGYAVDYQV